MLQIAGGAYVERCLEPNRAEFYGSGLRAAVALSHLGQVHLHAYSDEYNVAHLHVHTAARQIALTRYPVPRTVTFTYSHPLATPLIDPLPGYIVPANPIRVTGSAVLRFGMLEGSALVEGKRVVYDPQSPFNPRPFSENGSTALELAIVANRRELGVLSGKNEPEAIARELMDSHSASVVVIKQGTFGASVFWKSGSGRVPAFRTDRVWKIGSGDVFAAAFAHFWAVEEMPPLEAARRASAAAAVYCGTEAIPLSKDYFDNAINSLSPIEPSPTRTRDPLVYLAGPFFTMAERWLVNEARRALLQQGIRVFSPLHDVGPGAASDVVPADLNALDRSNVVLGIVDGTDAGTLFEIGYATAKRIPVVAFVQNEHPESLKMLQGSKCQIKDDFVSAIYSTVWAALT